MATYGPRSDLDWYRAGGLIGLVPTPTGGLELPRTNRWPNQFFQAFEPGGDPVGHDLSGQAEPIVAYHVLAGARAASLSAVKFGSLSRQSTAPLKPGEFPWIGNHPIVRGVRAGLGKSKRKTPAPATSKLPSDGKGFAPGLYGFGFGLSKNGRATPMGGASYVEVGNDRSVRLTLPEAFSPGATHLDVYATPPGGTRFARQRRIPISSIRGRRDFELQGPFQDGPPPPRTNESGLGKPPAPRASGPLGRRDVVMEPGPHDLFAGEGGAGARYRFAVQLEKEGRSLVSVASREITVTGDVVRERIRVPVDEPAGAAQAILAERIEAEHGSSDLALEAASDDSAYLAGEEVEPDEAGLSALVDERRRSIGLSDLPMVRRLNRLAQRRVNALLAGGAPMDSPREFVARVPLGGETHAAAWEALDAAGLDEGRWAVMGVARGRDLGSGVDVWVVVVQDERDFPEIPEDLGCQHYEGHAGEAHEDVRLSWDLVRSFEDGSDVMTFSVRSSYASQVRTGLGRWAALKSVAIREVSSNPDVMITDAALESGIYGRCYSDGRIHLSSPVFSRGTANANMSCIVHEAGHAQGHAHYDGNSVMRPSIRVDSTANIESPTSYDESEHYRFWGKPVAAPSPAPAPAPAPPRAPDPVQPPPPPPDPAPTPTRTPTPSDPRTPPRTRYKYVWRDKRLSVKRGTGFRFRVPEAVKRTPGMRWIPWVLVDDVTNRAYRKGTTDPDAAFGNNRGPRSESGVMIYGHPQDSEPAGLRVGLKQEEPPKEDGSVVEPFDPSSAPDPPEAFGPQLPVAGVYPYALEGVTASGEVLGTSEARTVSLAQGESAVVDPPTTINKIKNAEWTAKDAEKMALHWSADGFVAGVAAHDAADGVLSIETASASSIDARYRATDAIPLNREETWTFSGVLSVTRRTAGGALIALAEYQDDGTFLRGTVIARLDSVGTLAPARTFGPAGSGADHEWHPEATSVRPVAGLSRDAEPSSNVSVRVSHLSLLPFRAAVRRVEPRRQTGEPDTFEPAAKTPLLGSYVAVGPAPTPPGTSPPEAEPPLGVATFDGGAFPAGANWRIEQRNVDSTVEPAGRIHGTHGWVVRDPLAGAAGRAAVRYVDDALRGSGAVRMLVRIVLRPLYGLVTLLGISSATAGLAELLQMPDGRLAVAVRNPATGNTITADVAAPAHNASLLDVELSVAGCGTKSGVVTCSVGSFGGPRKVVYQNGYFDYRAHHPRSLAASFRSSDPRDRWEYHADQVVVTRFGDVQKRESSAPPPAGVAPPEIDAPRQADGSPSLHDEDGNRKNQLYVFNAPGDAPASAPFRMPLLDRPIPVAPGETCTAAARGRWANLTPETAPGLVVTLRGPGLEPLVVDRSDGEGGIGKGMAGEAAWSDSWFSFSVPPMTLVGGELTGYTEAWVELVTLDGVYVFQDFFWGGDRLPLESQRDARRGYGRAREGSFELVIDSRHEAGPLSGGSFLSRIGAERAEGKDLAGTAGVSYSSSTYGLAFYEASADPDAVVERRFYRIAGSLAGDGREGASLSRVFVETFEPVGELLRADGSPFPGGAYLGMLLIPTEYPDAESDRIGGVPYHADETEPYARLRDVTIAVTTEAALREIEATGTGEFLAAIPHALDAEEGQLMRVRFYERPLFETEEKIVSRILEDDFTERQRRHLYAAADAGEAYVVEMAPQLGPRRNLLAANAVPRLD